MKCAKCGANNPDTAKFCRGCGNKLEMPKTEGDFSQGLNAQAAGPNRQSAGPNAQAAGPNRQSAGPNAQAAGPNRQSAGPNAQAAGPNRQSAGPNAQSAGPNRQSAGPNPHAAGPNPQQRGAVPPPPPRRSGNFDFKGASDKAKNVFGKAKSNFDKIDFKAAIDKVKTKFDKYDKKTKIQMAAGAVVALLVLIYLFKPHPLVVNLENYVSVEFTGYDSRGSVHVVFDEAAFREKYLKKNKTNGREILGTYMDAGSYGYEYLAVDAMPPFVDVYVTPEGSVSNGDKVEVTFEYDNKAAAKAKLKYKGDKIKAKVKGLEDVPVVDLAKYCSVNFSGINTRGTAELNIDYEELDQQAYGLSDYFSCQITPQENLANGDTVTVSFSVDEEGALDDAKVALSAEEFTVEVNGLQEIESIDPFEGVKVSFTGIAPFAKVAEVTGAEGIEFNLDRREGLDLGEEVVLSVTEDTKNRLYEEGRELAVTEKTYKVEDVGEYIRDPEKISEDGMNYLKSEAEDRIEAYYGEKADRLELRSQEFCGTSVIYLKNREDYHYNRIVLLYKVDGYNKEKEEGYIRYYPCRFKEYIQNPDGSIYGGEIDINWDEAYDSLQDFHMRYLAPYKSDYKVVMSAELSELMAK